MKYINIPDIVIRVIDLNVINALNLHKTYPAAINSPNKDARLVLIAANCPQQHVEMMVNDHPNIPVHRLAMVNRELGSACAKPFSVSSVCVIDAGQSELMTLDHNL